MKVKVEALDASVSALTSVWLSACKQTFGSTVSRQARVRRLHSQNRRIFLESACFLQPNLEGSKKRCTPNAEFTLTAQSINSQKRADIGKGLR